MRLRHNPSGAAAGVVLAAACLVLLVSARSAPGESVRVIRFADGVPFQMGDVTSYRLVHPGMGARNTTLNYSLSRPGAEFAQHVHDASDDTILVLQGQVNLRQGDALRLCRAGEAVFVPAGQIHGTVTAGAGPAIMISFQNPPDLALYTGARDSSKSGAAPPQGAITPGAVKFVSFSDKNGLFTSPLMGSRHAAAAHRRLSPSESFAAGAAAGAEQFLFVLKGAIRVKHSGGDYTAGEKDTVFITGPAEVTVTAAAAGETRLIQVLAPPPA